MKVTRYHQAQLDYKPLFSILIPSWNNLPYLANCVRSIKQHSTYRHEIIVHINEGEDGTLEWVQEQGLSYSYSPDNAGVCYAFNAAAALAQSDLLVLSDDDMYYCPGWDAPLYEEVSSIDHPYFCINGTVIEPRATANNCVIAPYNYGDDIFSFNENELLAHYRDVDFGNWTGGNWYPMVLHRYTWNLIGGLSVEFSPGMGSDPDMMMKLWKAGVRYYKGIGESRVYHFMSRSVSRVKKNNGYRQFLDKWGLSIGTFFRYYLRAGAAYNGALHEPVITRDMQYRLLKDRVKRKAKLW